MPDRLDGESSTCLLRQRADQGKRSLFAMAKGYAKVGAEARRRGAVPGGVVNEGAMDFPRLFLAGILCLRGGGRFDGKGASPSSGAMVAKR